MGAATEAGRSTASRLLAVLGAFERGRPVMNLTRLSAEAGLPIATTFRITKELVKWGAIEKNADGSFQIGIKLWEVGSLAPRPRELRQVARPIMDSLHEATGEVVQLAVVEEHHALCVEKVYGMRSATNITEVAGRLPLHATGVGKAILAFDDGALVAGVIDDGLTRYTERTIVDPRLLDEGLRKIRHEYVSYCRDELTLGTGSVAAPIFDSEGDLVASIGILTGSATNLSRLAPAVRTAAFTISRRLGHGGTDWPLRARG